MIKPDGKLYVQSGIGNHGTGSVSDCHRVSAELLGMPWEKVVIASGDTSKNLPWTCPSGGSQTIHAMTRAAHAAGMDAKKKLQEIAAKDLGGRPEDYEVANERVFRKGGGPGMTLAKAAQRAIELGGVYDGHELPKDVNRFTTASATALAGQGLMGVAKDNYPRDGQSRSFVAGFAEVEIDVETGKYYILDYLAVADVGTVIHPRNVGGQILGRSMLGIGHAIGQKWVLRPAVRRRAGEAIPSQPAADDSRCAGAHAVGRGRSARSGNAGRRAWHWRTAGRCRRVCGSERDQRCAGRRNLPARAGDARHDFDCP